MELRDTGKMMSYEDFKKAVTELFKDYLPEKYKDRNVIIKSVEKINRTLDGISLADSEGKTVSPVIYVNNMYGHYKGCGNLQDVMKLAATKMEQGIRKFSDYTQPDFEDAESKIVFQLVNTEQNRELLKSMPHREFNDLSVIYRLVVKLDGQEMHSAAVKSGLADMLGFDEGELFKLAKKNTARIFPVVVKPLEDIWVITNERGMNGAAYILYGDVLHALSEKLRDDMYILPSSLHEVIAVPASIGKPDGLARMVYEMNMEQVGPGERLSNQVYHYDRDLRTLTLATDTANRRLV